MELNSCKSELRNILNRDEQYGRQRSRVHWLKERDHNSSFFHQFYTDLFRSNNGSTSNTILDAIETCITLEMNTELCSGFTAEEVKRAFFQIHPQKAPGLDGFLTSFFPVFGI
ncbi:hypothetical protein V6N12_066997 [Hibiscus sabdariffa]|uniref:Reverse transcriptase n=1 Tax=Hibiscus sabdariffa TaxID=183260 RepID=A0ABR2BKI4_9ROSI